MIAGIVLYWVWVLLALILDYVCVACVYYCDDEGNKTDQRAEYPMWQWLVFAAYPFIPVVNVVGFFFLFIMLWMAEQRKDAYRRGKFFEDVKTNKQPSDGNDG